MVQSPQCGGGLWSGIGLGTSKKASNGALFHVKNVYDKNNNDVCVTVKGTIENRFVEAWNLKTVDRTSRFNYSHHFDHR